MYPKLLNFKNWNVHSGDIINCQESQKNETLFNYLKNT